MTDRAATFIAIEVKGGFSVHQAGCRHLTMRTPAWGGDPDGYIGQSIEGDTVESFTKWIKDLVDGVTDDGVASFDNKARIAPCVKGT